MCDWGDINERAFPGAIFFLSFLCFVVRRLWCYLCPRQRIATGRRMSRMEEGKRGTSSSESCSMTDQGPNEDLSLRESEDTADSSSSSNSSSGGGDGSSTDDSFSSADTKRRDADGRHLSTPEKKPKTKSIPHRNVWNSEDFFELFQMCCCKRSIRRKDGSDFDGVNREFVDKEYFIWNLPSFRSDFVR